MLDCSKFSHSVINVHIQISSTILNASQNTFPFMQFPSMAPLQNALPSGQPASHLVHTPGYGNPTSPWMPHQLPSNLSQLPLQGPYPPTMPSSKMSHDASQV